MEGPVGKADLGAAGGRPLSLRMDRSLPAETKSQILKQAGQSSRLTEEGPARRDGWGQCKAETKTWLKRARRAGREGTKLSLVTLSPASKSDTPQAFKSMAEKGRSTLVLKRMGRCGREETEAGRKPLEAWRVQESVGEVCTHIFWAPSPGLMIAKTAMGRGWGRSAFLFSPCVCLPQEEEWKKMHLPIASKH